MLCCMYGTLLPHVEAFVADLCFESKKLVVKIMQLIIHPSTNEYFDRIFNKSKTLHRILMFTLALILMIIR